MIQNIQKRMWILLVVLSSIFISGFAHSVSDESNSKKVYVIVANRLSLQDIKQMDNLNDIIKYGSLGLMNTRGAIGYKGAEGYVTINASSKAYANYGTSKFFNLDKEKIAIYQRRTGLIGKGHEIANIDINKLLSLNKDKSYAPYIGALGDNLHNSGLKTAVFGNSDTADSFVRTSGLIAVDSKGLIDYGNVDYITVEDDQYPFGFKTNYDKLITEINETSQNASLIVIDTGDLDRLFSYSGELTDEMYVTHRKRILRDIDDFIRELYNSIDKDNSMMMIISPNAPDEKVDASKLSPIVVWEKEITKGILTSGTTRRNGIVANLDIAPTITNYLGTDSDNFVGHAMSVNYENSSFNYIYNLNQKTNIISKLRSPFLTTYSIIVIVSLIISMLILVLSDIVNKKIKKLISAILLILLILPLSFLLVSIFSINNATAFMLAVTAIVLVLFLMSYKIKRQYRLFSIILLTFIILSIDIAIGGKLTKYSILGYDPIIGARYFGVGNELVGVFLAVLILSIVFFLDKVRRHKIVLVFLPIGILLVAHPNLGANVGGTISVLFASIVLTLLIFDVKIDFKRILLMVISVVMIIVLMGIIDIYINPNPTHLGQTLMMVFKNGPASLINVIIRKLQMNIKLIGVSIWSKVIFTCIVIISILIKFFKTTLFKLFDINKFFASGLISALLGVIVGLLVNDSGILLAAISSIYITVALLYEVIVSEC